MTGRRWKNRALIRERDGERARRLWITLALVALATNSDGWLM